MSAASASATIYTVTRSDDPPPSSCAVGNCSLREAVIAANGDSSPDVINLTPGSYPLTNTSGGGGAVGDLDITNPVTIQTTNGDDARIVGPTNDRVFEVLSGSLTLKDVSPWFGTAQTQTMNSVQGEYGGGVEVHAGSTFVMDGGSLEHDIAEDPDPNDMTVLPGRGGAIYNEGVTVLNGVTVANDSTNFGFGGGVYTAPPNTTVAEGDGDATINDSDLTSNFSGFGGAVANLGGHLTVRRSYLSANQADRGGAAYLAGGTAFIENDTVDGNKVVKSGNGGNPADADGGAFKVRNSNVSVNNSTITRNDASNGGGIAAENADGFTSSVTLENTVLAGNTDNAAADGTNPDCKDESNGGIFTSDGYNIVGNGAGCGLTASTGDHIGTAGSPIDAGVAAPDFNGGPSIDLLSDALKSGSPALNAGNPASGVCAPTDGRSLDRSLGGRCDIGAYEQATCGGVIVNRIGTDGNDQTSDPLVAPTAGPDGILGLASGDELSGGAGNDGLCGGPASDGLDGDGGNDVLDGGESSDVLDGGPGEDTLNGGGGPDKLAGSKGADRLVGGPGDDKLVGGPGKDVCIGGPGKDTATGCEVKRGIP